MCYGRYNWLWGVLIGMGLALLASRLSYGLTPPGTVITLRADVCVDGHPVDTAQTTAIVVSPGWIAAGRPTVYVCPSPAEPLANGWRVRRLLDYGAGCPNVVDGIQTIDGWLWFGPTGGGSR